MKIGNGFELACLVVGLLLASAITTLASGSGSVMLHENVVVQGKALSAGKYHVRWMTHSPEATIEFKKGHNAVVSTEGVYVDRGQRCPRNMYVTETDANGTRKLLEVRFAGSSKVLTFN